MHIYESLACLTSLVSVLPGQKLSRLVYHNEALQSFVILLILTCPNSNTVNVFNSLDSKTVNS